MKRILLTGTSGFIGKALAEYLLRLEDTSICQLLRTPGKAAHQGMREGTVLRYDGTYQSVAKAIDSFRPDVVVHLASVILSSHSADQISSIVDGNITLGSYLLEAMARTGCRKLVNTGTSWQHYGDAAYNPVNLYAASKQAFEDIARFYHEAFGFAVFHLHLFDTFGPGDSRRKLLALLRDVFRNDEALGMTCGEQEINLTHVDDITCAYLCAIDSISRKESCFETYAVRHPETVTVKELVSLIENLTEKKAKIEWCAQPYRDREMMKAWSGGRILDGWVPQLSLRDGLAEYFSQG